MKIKRKIKKQRRVNVVEAGRWLPDELLMELLARLPAKNLFQCMSVSKNWCLFIRDQNFIEAHRRHNRTAGLVISIPVASQQREGFFSQQQFYYSSLREEQPPEDFVCRLKLPSSGPSDFKGFTQVVEGLFCFYGHNINGGGAVSVSNVTTGEIMNIPNNDSLNDAPTATTAYHLGFDPVNGVYKLLRIRISRRSEELNFHNNGRFIHLLEAYRTFYHNYDYPEVIWRSSASVKSYDNRYYRECEILTLGRDSAWRKLHGDVPVALEMKSVYVNGFIFWMFNDYEQDLLVSFDLNKEVFRFVKPGPLTFPYLPETFRVLAEFEGKLAVMETSTVNSEYFQLYTLDDVEETSGYSWKRHYIHDLPSELVHGIGGVASRGIVPVGNLPTGEILFANPDPSWDYFTPVYSYDHRYKKFKKFVIGSFPPSFDLRSGYGPSPPFQFQICCLKLKENFEPLDVLFSARK